MKTHIIHQRAWKMYHLITRKLVFVLYKVANRSDGGDNKWHFVIKQRNQTNW